MENRNRILLGIGVEIFQGSTSEERGCLAILDHAKQRFGYHPESLGADKGFFHEEFIRAGAAAKGRASRRSPREGKQPGSRAGEDAGPGRGLPSLSALSA